MTTLLYDADEICYGSCSGCMRETCFGSWYTWDTDLDEVKQTIRHKIKQAQDRTGADVVQFAMSDPSHNFRKDIYPEYKSHRKTTRKPLAYGAAIEWLEEEYECFMMPSLEADDVMGILSPNVDYLVASDKDMLTIPGVAIVSPYHDLEIRGPLTEEEADDNWLGQVLTGDSVDGYGGCPRVGKVTAAKILAEVEGEELDAKWARVVAAFSRGGQTEEDALLQGRLARILRPGEYDLKTSKPVLWTP